ncbi:MAG: NAD(P)(+) transhydrogenase (Re/Si-specific) subunit beta, partial [Phycisphaeraceae bacterium]|nr:NAD(P)(+) transhydrogenase (Re/Si-specific) subunit beta [Phycisphaeraceae bacterium]
DVTNPAARHDTASPIYGMPILDVDKANSVIVIKRSLNPGFAGVENELYYMPNCGMLFGDGKAMVNALVNELKES